MGLSAHSKSASTIPYNILLIVIAVALLTALISILYARPPRRRITIRRLPSVPLRAPAADVELHKAGTIVAWPYLTNIIMESTGRRDIRSADFGMGESMSVALGVPVVSVDIHSEFENNLSISAHGRTLEIGPGLLKRGLQLTIRAITDGPIDEIGIKSPLADAVVELAYDTEIIRYRGSREEKRVRSNEETEKRAKLTITSEVSVIAALIVAILAWLFPRK